MKAAAWRERVMPQKDKGAMNSRQIECFLVTGKLLNFTKAAESLYLPQSAVSRYISSLEKELGTKLFLRENNRRITLSDEGKVYYNLFQRFSAELSNTRKLLTDSSSVVRLGYNVGWNLSAFLPKVIEGCRAALPDFRITLQCLGMQELVSALANHRLDAVITMEDNLEQETEIECRRITSIQRTIVYSELLKGYQHISDPSDFYSYDFFIADAPHMREVFESTEKVFHPYQFVPRLTSVPNLETAFAFIENGLGVALLDEWCQSLHTPGVHRVDLDEYLPIALGWHRHSVDPAIAVMLDELTAYFERQPEGRNA